jgi:hypothetical protein
MGQIVVAAANSSGNNNNNNNQTVAASEIRSTSMFDWQYELQKKLQNSTIINYTDAQLTAAQRSANNNSHMVAHDNTTSFTQPTANASGTPIPEHRLPHENNSTGAMPRRP